MELFRLLIGTVELRPYVFIFFAIYLAIAITTIGLKRTIIFTVLAYTIAFLSEYSSSHGDSGIPFGVYRYVQSTRDRELWVAGVPFMDSLSFTFLSFVSWRLSVILLWPGNTRNRLASALSGGKFKVIWTAALAGFLMMYLDIIIDPVALQGKKWFLGEIYYYPGGGLYFGVTLANFAGWFVVCMVIVLAYSAIDSRLGERLRSMGVREFPLQWLAPAGLYFGILGFNLWMTFRIGETTMGLAGLFITLPLLLAVALSVLRGRFGTGPLNDS
ncbi:MAG TPA: carotenoid biosynthesis protein [Blastocatellia bacterium]|nr:carotenoid biosynthesis protein [Blastocatellia bacterium]